MTTTRAAWRPGRFRAGIPFVLLLVCALARGGELELSVLSEAGEPIPCRVVVRAGSRSFVPEGATTLETGPDRWFMSSGRSRVTVPDGEVLVRVERGLEYVRLKQMVRVASDSHWALRRSRTSR